MKTPIVLLAILIVGRPVGFAQTAPAAPADRGKDDVVTLSEFTVSGAGDNGYMPAESTSGSRVAVKIQDLPYAVNVVTAEFLKDFNVFDITEEMAYTSSVSGLDQGGGFSVRGFGGNIVLRNGFSRLGNFDRTSADRIEFIKGPAAAIYGQTNPGGIVNFITKQPRSRPRQSLMLSAGSYHTTREELELTGPIGSSGKLYYILNGSWFERDYQSPYQLTRTQSGYFGLIYKASPGTNLSFNFDYVRQHNNVVAIPETFIATNPPHQPLDGTGHGHRHQKLRFAHGLEQAHRFHLRSFLRAPLQSDLFDAGRREPLPQPALQLWLGGELAVRSGHAPADRT